MKLKFDRRVLLATLGAVVAVVLIWYLALWQPRLAAIAAKKSAYASAQQALASEEALVNQYKTGTGISSTEAQAGVLATAIPDSVDLSGIINDVYAAVETSGVGLTNITPATPTAAGGTGSGSVQTVHLTLSVTGRYFQIVAFLDQLQQLPRIFVVTSVGLTGGSVAQPASPTVLFTPNLTASIAASVFFTGAASATSGATGATGATAGTAGAPPSGSSSSGAPGATPTTSLPGGGVGTSGTSSPGSGSATPSNVGTTPTTFAPSSTPTSVAG